jgi:hypothetical protein
MRQETNALDGRDVIEITCSPAWYREVGTSRGTSILFSFGVGIGKVTNLECVSIAYMLIR